MASDKFDDLRSKISSVVGGLLSINDISINAGGPRQDAANENARRLADIANIGLADQSWMEEFKTEVPAISMKLSVQQTHGRQPLNSMRNFRRGCILSYLTVT